MKTRTIKMPVDGRRFSGSPVDIFQQMRTLAFGWDGQPLDEYLDWLKTQMEQQTGADIDVPDGDEAVRCEALLNAMIAHGLALEIVSGG